MYNGLRTSGTLRKKPCCAGRSYARNFREWRKDQLRRIHHGRTSGSLKLHSWVTTLGQQGTEPDLRIYAVVHRCEVVVLEFASFTEGGKSRLFCLDVLVSVQRVQRADERTRTAFLISLRMINQALQGFAGVC